MIRAVPLLLAACASAPEPAARPPAAEPEPVVDPGPSPDEPPAAKPEPAPEPQKAGFAALSVPGFLDAVLFLPAGEPRHPLVVATHGAGGEPEWTCAAWAEHTRGEAFVLCPRGRAISQQADHGYYYPDHHALKAEVLASLDALTAALGERAPSGEIVYTGYSQGATMGVLFLTDHAARFSRLVLTEGGFEGWTRSSAERYAKGGGKRVLFVCGGSGCEGRAKKASALLEKAGVAARVDLVRGGGHTDGGRVGAHLSGAYPWVLRSDPE